MSLKDLTGARGPRLPAVGRADSHATRWSYFIGALVLASVLPMLVIPAIGVDPQKGTLPFYAQYVLIAASSNFHVGATGWFFSDREMRSHFLAQPTRYIVAPILTMAATTAAFIWCDDQVTQYVLTGALVWLFWHYQKQNIGVLSFLCAGTERVSPTIWERRTLILAGLAGIAWLLCTTKHKPLQPVIEIARQPLVEMALLVPAIVALGIALATTPQIMRNPLRFGMLLYGVLFFIPIALFPEQGIGAPGVAHGLQYVAFMLFVSARSAASIPSVVVMLFSATLGLFLVDDHPRIRELLGVLDRPWFGGLMMGVVMSHFILDAGIWRLREPFQRNYMRRKFDFIFG